MHTVSVVVPVYNSARSLPELVGRLEAVRRDERSFQLIEVVLVDDGSADTSWQVVTDLAGRHPWVKGLRLGRNFGQHSAILAGLGSCCGEVIVTMDDDLQHRPEEIRLLLEALSPETDVVYGRSHEEEHAAFRNFTSRVTKRAISTSAGTNVASWVSGFRAFRANLIPILQAQHGPFVSLDVPLAWATSGIRPASVAMDQRRYGSSNYTLSRLVRHALTMLFGFTTVPLRVVTWLGLTIGAMGGGLLVYVVVRYFVAGSDVPGFAFIASTVAMFSGVQLLALGIIAEYVGRLYAGASGRPAFVMRDQVGMPSDSEKV